MSRSPRPSRPSRPLGPLGPTVLLAAVWGAAFAIRGLYLWQISHAPFFELRLGDAEAYHAWALRIAAGDWVGQDVFYQSPLYPYFLAVIYRVLGDGVMGVRIAQAIVGATSCALLGAAGISLFGRRGIVAGFGLALYPAALFMDASLDKSALVTFFTAALLWLVAAPRERMTARTWFAMGAILGLLVLTRENALLLIVPLVIWVAGLDTPALKGRPTGDRIARVPLVPRLRAVAVFVAGCAIVLLPVGVRNYAVGGEFHLTTSQFGPNLYIGNHAGATGTYEPLAEGHGSADDERADAVRLAEQAAGRRLTAREVSSYWTTRAVEYMRSQPSEWLGLMGRKTALTFNAAEVTDTESQEVYAEWSSLLQAVARFDFGVLFAFAAAGIVVTANHWRRLWILYAIALTYAASVVIFYVFARYRFPIVPVLMLLTAGGIAHAPSRHSIAAHPRPMLAAARVTLAFVALLLAFAYSYRTLEDAAASRANHYAGIASTFGRANQAEQAIGFYERALREMPDLPVAHLGLGTLLSKSGRYEEAIPHLRAAVEARPGHAEARYNFGLALAAAGRVEEAATQFREALRIRADDADTHIALAKALIILERHDEAVSHYRRGLALRPDHVTALVGLGVALTHVGKSDEAIEAYRRALQLDPANAAAHNSLGFTLASAGRIAEALPHFERAVALDPGNENAKKNLDQARRVLK